MLTPAGEVIDQATERLTDYGIDVTKSGYRRFWKMLTTVGVGMGLEVAERDIDHWVINTGIMRAVDDLIDDEGITDVTDYVKAITEGEVIPGMTEAEVGLASEVYDVYTPQRRGRQIEQVSSLADFAILRSRARTVRDYKAHTLAESAMFTDVLAISDFDRHTNESAEQRFDHWLRHTMNLGYWVDMAQDIQEDNQTGVSNVPPTLYNRAQFVGLAAVESVRTVVHTPPRVLPHLARLSLSYLR